MRDFAGKIAVVTGASSGIGRAISRQLAAAGARLILTSRRQSVLEEVAREIAPAEAVPIAADLRDWESLARLTATIKQRFGRLDLLVNNAGVGLHALSVDTPPDLVRQLFELNFFAPVELARQLVPLMPRGSAVINVSSIAGKIPLPDLNIYCASKYALNAFSDGLWIELRHRGIHVMSVCPGYVKTSFGENLLLGRPIDNVPGRKRFTISADECARATLDGLRRDRRTVVVPRIGWILIGFARLFPNFVFQRMADRIKRRNNEAVRSQA
jgi:short-subunit dehydrogenase